MRPYDAAIIGAGPAGLLCARNAARKGLRIALVDAHSDPGAKLAVAGGGKGNITNRILDERRYIGGDTSALRSVLGEFGCEDALALLRELGLPWEERDFGQIFGTKPAYLIAERLAVQADDAGADFYLGRRATDITRPSPAAGHAFGRGAGKDLFTLNAGRDRIEARSLVIASGSPAAPQLGADGSLLDMAKSWGHATVPFRPVLVPLTMQPGWPLAGLEGISLNVRTGIRRRDGTLYHPDPSGIRSLLFTHRGVSGPAALVASCFLSPGDALVIDFLPENPILEILDQKDSGRLLVRSVLSRRMPQRLADALCPADLARRKTAELGKADRARIAEAVHAFYAVPSGTEGFRRAEAAAGGIAMESLGSDLQSTVVSGLFFCGEILDVTGILGGYNIHWALASGARVATALRAS